MPKIAKNTFALGIKKNIRRDAELEIIMIRKNDHPLIVISIRGNSDSTPHSRAAQRSVQAEGHLREWAQTSDPSISECDR
jgi:hypothetical protein